MKSLEGYVQLLGLTAKDKVTGCVGVISSVSFDLYGCVQVVVAPGVDKDGKLKDNYLFDVHRMELLPEERKMPVPDFPAIPSEHKKGPAEKSALLKRP